MSKDHNSKLVAFLQDLCAVLEKHNGGLTYTADDDGVRAYVSSWRAGNTDVSIGWPRYGNTSEIKATIKRLLEDS